MRGIGSTFSYAVPKIQLDCSPRCLLDYWKSYIYLFVSFQSLPFFYPANRLEYFNGTHFKDDKFPSGDQFILGFQGHVTSSEYDAMTKQPHFGMKTPMTFDGYNSDPGDFFPFWSSDAYTYAVTLTALSQHENIKKERN